MEMGLDFLYAFWSAVRTFPELVLFFEFPASVVKTGSFCYLVYRVRVRQGGAWQWVELPLGQSICLANVRDDPSRLEVVFTHSYLFERYRRVVYLRDDNALVAADLVLGLADDKIATFPGVAKQVLERTAYFAVMR